ncbi:hemerythrin domain-containing protein [Micromonospora sp. 4G55]|uniref:hemerythrin domain-containing protein n=1 Tax=Micromonospora sp. 4G55 TaxID=2806102 RepID=UPI001A47243F|nr:hemerythrin domain-containing protein [Micromonospora sp. 4G55]MBM0255644.1 hemerythrin domain-containing protein [Micromonospora sp. 4G55]
MTRTDDDVIDVLLAQHARIEELFRTVLSTTGDEKRKAFDDLVRLLAVHETAEEEIVHPYARRAIEAGGPVVDDRLAEEHRAKEHLADLYERGLDAPDFRQRLLALRDEVIAHATREERYEFTYLRSSVDADRLQAMAAAVRAAEAMAPTRPHPGAESPTANLLLGPPLAVYDRVRDIVRDRVTYS